MKSKIKNLLIALAFCPLSALNAQTEVMAWGNITGYRIDGELIEFETSLRVGELNKGNMEITGKEKQSYPIYHRDGNIQKVTTLMKGIQLHQTVEELQHKETKINLIAESDTTIRGEKVYFCVELPAPRYGSVIIDNGHDILLTGKGRRIKIEVKQARKPFVRRENGNQVLYIPLMNSIKEGRSSKLELRLEADGEIDHSPARLELDTKQPGQLFVGFGGNFRLQNPDKDPAVIDYCLNNLRVAYGRVEMPWQRWQPDETTDPIAEAQNGRLDKHVQESMEMARRLAAKGMPVIVSCWFPPKWAIDGDPASYKRQGGIQAYRLDPTKREKIYQSMADYLIYLKQAYGVEAEMFSFNESDLGIDVLFTGEEHARFIKEFGAYLASRGLKTLLLLGDNSDATTINFISPALADPATHRYIGAVSFHSWRGCDDETLRRWAAAARQINKPLIVGEGSTDAAAWRYPEIFGESTFAFYEINLYVRLCALCQPLSILQWQLTADYSPLWGNGIFGSTGPLRPTQRFWNLKQLASTPEESFALPITCDKTAINATAFGNIARGEYALHLVNNGAAREATVTGLPKEVTSAQMYVTSPTDQMRLVNDVVIQDGEARISLPPLSFVTIIIK